MQLHLIDHVCEPASRRFHLQSPAVAIVEHCRTRNPGRACKAASARLNFTITSPAAFPWPAQLHELVEDL